MADLKWAIFALVRENRSPGSELSRSSDRNRGVQRNEVLLDAMNEAARAGRALHLMGLVSPGGVHSHQNHIYTLVEMARDAGVEDVYIHAFLDGRMFRLSAPSLP